MHLTSSVETVATGLIRVRHLFVNVYLIGTDRNWVLVDAAMAGAADEII